MARGAAVQVQCPRGSRRSRGPADRPRLDQPPPSRSERWEHECHLDVLVRIQLEYLRPLLDGKWRPHQLYGAQKPLDSEMGEWVLPAQCCPLVLLRKLDGRLWHGLVRLPPSRVIRWLPRSRADR